MGLKGEAGLGEERAGSWVQTLAPHPLAVCPWAGNSPSLSLCRTDRTDRGMEGSEGSTYHKDSVRSSHIYGALGQAEFFLFTKWKLLLLLLI